MELKLLITLFLTLQVDQDTFKKKLWTVLQPELTLPWEQHNFDTLNLLLAAHERFPKIVKKAALSNSLGVDSLSDPECFNNLTQFIVVSLAILLSNSNF